MTIADALKTGTIDPLDREILLAAALKQGRTWVISHTDELLTPLQELFFIDMITRRAAGEPVAYILGEKEFYGRMFEVNRATLIPRPATELLVEQVLHVLAGKKPERILSIDQEIVAWTETRGDMRYVQLVADVGTGSGCIAVTIACERPDLRLIATDISEEALETARRNAQRHGVEERITFKLGKGFVPLTDIAEPFLLVSNPPYIPQKYILPADVANYEPRNALYAGEEGTDVLKPLVIAAQTHQYYRGHVIECREEQISLE